MYQVVYDENKHQQPDSYIYSMSNWRFNVTSKTFRRNLEMALEYDGSGENNTTQCKQCCYKWNNFHMELRENQL